MKPNALIGDLCIVLFLLPSLGLVHSSEYLKCFVPGECRDSQILDVTSQNDSTRCLRHCQATQGCEWFTFYEDSKACASLSGCLDLNATYCDRCISGETECPEYTCGVQGKCFGAMEGVRLVNNTDDCQSECSKRAECNWHSFVPSSKSCILTNDCPALDKTCTDCVASEKGCTSTKVGTTPEGMTFADTSLFTLLRITYPSDAAELNEKEQERNLVLFTSKTSPWKVISLNEGVSVQGCNLPKDIPSLIRADNTFVHTDSSGQIALLSDSKSVSYVLDKSTTTWIPGGTWNQVLIHKTFAELGGQHGTWIGGGLKISGNSINSAVYKEGKFVQSGVYKFHNGFASVHSCIVSIGDGKVITLGGYVRKEDLTSNYKFWYSGVLEMDPWTGVCCFVHNLFTSKTFSGFRNINSSPPFAIR